MVALRRVNMKPPCPAWLLDRPIAHRGLHGPGRPENTLAAFEAAAAAGYPIELDVRQSLDGLPVVHHDDGLMRAAGIAGRVCEHPWSVLRGLRLFGTAEKLPSLQDVFDLVADRVPLLIEVKNAGRPGTLEDAVRVSIARYPGRVAVQGFSPHVVRWFGQAMPGVPRGQLSGALNGASLGRAQRLAMSNLLVLPYARPDFVAYELAAMTGARIAAFKALVRQPMLFWTIRGAAEAATAKALGGNIIFEGFTPS